MTASFPHTRRSLELKNTTERDISAAVSSAFDGNSTAGTDKTRNLSQSREEEGRMTAQQAWLPASTTKQLNLQEMKCPLHLPVRENFEKESFPAVRENRSPAVLRGSFSCSCPSATDPGFSTSFTVRDHHHAGVCKSPVQRQHRWPEG